MRTSLLFATVLHSVSFAATLFAQAPKQIGEPLPLEKSWSLKEADHLGIVTAMAWSPRKPLLATYMRAGMVDVRNANTWETVAGLMGPASERGCVGFSPDGKWLAAGGGGVVQIWKVSGKLEWKQVAKLDITPPADIDFDDDSMAGITEVAALTFTGDSKKLVVAGDSGKIEVWKTATWKRLELVGEQADREITCLGSWKKGKVLLFGGKGQRLRVLQRSGRKTWREQVVATKDAEDHEGMDLACASGKPLVAVGLSQKGRVRVVNWKDLKVVAEFAVRAGYIPAVAFSADEGEVHAASIDFATFDLPTNKVVRKFQLPSMAITMRMSPDGRLLAVSCEDATVRVYRVGDGN